MELSQIEKLKEETNDIRILKLLIDKEDYVISELINYLQNFKDDDMVRQYDNFEYLVNYISKAYEDKKNFNFSDIRNILNNSKSLLSSKRRELLEYLKSHDYSTIYGNFLMNPNYNCYSIKELDSFINYVINKGLINYVQSICNYRSLKEVEDIIENYDDYIINGKYGNLMAKYRTHEESKKQIATYEKLLNNISPDDKKVLNDLIFNSKNIYAHRNVDEHIKLMEIYLKYSNSMVLSLILDYNILDNKTFEEQVSLIRILSNNDFDSNIYNIIKQLSYYKVDEIFKIIGLYQKYPYFDFNKFINDNNNLTDNYIPFENFYNKLIKDINDSEKNYVTISKAMDKSNNIEDVIKIIKNSKLTSFNSKTKVLQLKIKDNK